MIDYKIVEQKEENGFVYYQKVRFYQGDITTEDELVLNEIVPVTRYRRTSVIETREYFYE